MGTPGPEREPEEGQGEGRKRIQAEGARDPGAFRSFKETLEKTSLSGLFILDIKLKICYGPEKRERAF